MKCLICGMQMCTHPYELLLFNLKASKHAQQVVESKYAQQVVESKHAQQVVK